MPADRYRCKLCGNLTRFTVTVTRTTRYYHHQAFDGTMTPEDEELIAEEVGKVECRWCPDGGAVEAKG